jgi:hypothetical protein
MPRHGTPRQWAAGDCSLFQAGLEGIMKKELAKRFYSFFSRFKKKGKSEDLLEIANLVGPLIDKLVMELLKDYCRQLLSEPITYIVPAVWGATKDGELDATQRRMHARISPVVDKIQSLLDLHDLRESQSFAIGFLIRGLIISKVTHMVASYQGRVDYPLKAGEYSDEYMMNIKPLGTA